MSEGLAFPDDSSETSGFDLVIDQAVPAQRVPLHFGSAIFWMTPENTTLRLFGDGLEEYSRALVEIDGETHPIKPGDDLLKAMRAGGFGTEKPDRLDETDRAFMADLALLNSEEDSQPGSLL